MSEGHDRRSVAWVGVAMGAIAIIVAGIAFIEAIDIGEAEPVRADQIAELQADVAVLTEDLGTAREAAAKSATEVDEVATGLDELTADFEGLGKRVRKRGATIDSIEADLATLQDKILPVQRLAERVANDSN